MSNYFDQELGQLCSVIMEPLRDRIVTSLLQASLVCSLISVGFIYIIESSQVFAFWLIIFQIYQDGLLRVLLDGGASRVFHPSESKLLEEDVEVLKVTLS